ncbi:mitochondrial ribosomal death-associated protein 3-domain-containing protein [Lipomyces arxii]|uniref:mitochondrial 37S ribosomal mS29 domain-containing protein n=1 Tax=Lipomyces arxii TaxID=56418 RepID=UPI0034CEB41F
MSRLLHQSVAGRAHQPAVYFTIISRHQMIHTSQPAFAKASPAEARVAISPFANRVKKMKAPLSTPKKANGTSIYSFKDTIKHKFGLPVPNPVNLEGLSMPPLSFSWFAKKHAGENDAQTESIEASQSQDFSHSQVEFGKETETTEEDAEFYEFKEPTTVVEDKYAELRDVNGLYEHAGRLCIYNDKTVDFLRKANAVLPKQYFNLFKEQATILKTETAALAQVLLNAKLNKESYRALIVGKAGMGKSVVLQQLIALARTHEAFVIHIPDAEDLVDGWVDYQYNEAEGIYDQQMYTSRLMKQMYRSNSAVLKKFQLTESYTFSSSRTETTTLEKSVNTVHDLLKFGAAHSRSAVPVFKALIAELKVPRVSTIPIVVSVDNVSIFADKPMTAYRTKDYKSIPYDQFYLPKLIVDLFEGKESFPCGFTVGATSSQSSNNLTMRRVYDQDQPTPYTDHLKEKYDDKLFQTFQSIDKIEVLPFTMRESRLMTEYFAMSGAIPDFAKIQDDFVYGRALVAREGHAWLQSRRNMSRYEAKIKVEESLYGPAASLTEPRMTKIEGVTLYSPRVFRELTDMKPAVLAQYQIDRKRVEENERLHELSADERQAEESAKTLAIKLAAEALKERKFEFWKRYVELKYFAAGGGVPRALTDSCLFPIM